MSIDTKSLLNQDNLLLSHVMNRQLRTIVCLSKTNLMKKLLLCLAFLLMLSVWYSRVLQVPYVEPKRILKVPKQDYTYFYFTSYSLDHKQTDSQPCIWASTKNLCKLKAKWIKTIAITKDIRELMSIKRWDTVQLIWDKWCEWTYQVHDEMAKRFRKWCILRNGVCIKWDIVDWVWWACRVVKL